MLIAWLQKEEWCRYATEGDARIKAGMGAHWLLLKRRTVSCRYAREGDPWSKRLEMAGALDPEARDHLKDRVDN